MATEKLASGRIVQDIGATVQAKPHGDAARASRNSLSRVFCADGEAWAVLAVINGQQIPIAGGTASAKPGTACAIMIRVRAEADVPPAVVDEKPAEVIR